MSKSAGGIIRKHYNKQPNIITPTVIAYGYVAYNIVYELSTGEGLTGNPIYGVTLVKVLPDGTTDDMSDSNKCLHSLEEANEYIAKLKTQ